MLALVFGTFEQYAPSCGRALVPLHSTRADDEVWRCSPCECCAGVEIASLRANGPARPISSLRRDRPDSGSSNVKVKAAWGAAADSWQTYSVREYRRTPKGRAPLHLDELQDLFDYADDRVDHARKQGCKGWISAFRTASARPLALPRTIHRSTAPL
jgi:hypothetical protein